VELETAGLRPLWHVECNDAFHAVARVDLLQEERLSCFVERETPLSAEYSLPPT